MTTRNSTTNTETVDHGLLVVWTMPQRAKLLVFQNCACGKKATIDDDASDEMVDPVANEGY